MSKFLPFNIISRKCKIFTSFLHPDNDGITDELYKQIEGQAHAYLFLWWSSINKKEEYSNWYKILSKYTNIDTTVLCPTIEDCNILSEIGFKTLFCHHSSFLDDELFYAYEKRQPIYNAIYNAQILPYKRIELCKDLRDWCLISHTNENKDIHSEYRKTILHLIGDRTLKNPNIFLQPKEVCNYINQSKCGLMLSAEEGGNYATVEYLLCGIPVITTPNIGGRNEFLNKENSIMIHPDSYSVASAVNTLRVEKFDKFKIRTSVLEVINKHRSNFYKNLTEKFGGDWETDYIYCNKLLNWTNNFEL